MCCVEVSSFPLYQMSEDPSPSLSLSLSLSLFIFCVSVKWLPELRNDLHLPIIDWFCTLELCHLSSDRTVREEKKKCDDAEGRLEVIAWLIYRDREYRDAILHIKWWQQISYKYKIIFVIALTLTPTIFKIVFWFICLHTIRAYVQPMNQRSMNSRRHCTRRKGSTPTWHGNTSWNWRNWKEISPRRCLSIISCSSM